MWKTLWSVGSGLTQMVQAMIYPESKTTEPPLPQPEQQPETEIPWEQVLKSIRVKDYSRAITLLSVTEPLRQALQDNDNGNSTKERLQVVCRNQLFHNVRNSQHEVAAKYAILYTQVGGPVPIVLEFLFQQSKIALEKEFQITYEQVLETLEEKPSGAVIMQRNCIDALGKLFEYIAIMLGNYEYVEQISDPRDFLRLIKNIQPTCQTCALKYIDFFKKDWKISDVIQSHSDGTYSLKISEPAAVTGLLDDMVLIQRHVEVYKRFIRKYFQIGIHKLLDKGYTFYNVPHLAEVDNQLNLTNYVEEPVQLYEQTEELMKLYSAIMPTYINLAIDEIFSIEDFNPQVKSSPAMDDVFLLFQTCLHRTATTRDATLLMKVTQDLLGCIQKHLIPCLLRRYTEVEPSQKGILNTPKNSYSIYLNDLTIAPQYATKLRLHLVEDVNSIFKRKEEGEDDLLEKTIKYMDDAIKQLTEAASSVVLRLSRGLSLHITPNIRSFARYNYQITDVDFKNAQINDPWVEMFITTVRTILTGYKGFLTSESNDMLVASLIKIITGEIEATILQKNFSQHGGLQFNSDLQKIMNFFEEFTKKPVRDKFLRLNEIKDLLVLEKANEVLEYWGVGEIKWCLTAIEVKLFLKRRTDFQASVIDRLKLQ